MRGKDCFDADYFIQRNQDLVKNMQSNLTTSLAWRFFVYYGQFEDRPFRYTCEANYSLIATPFQQQA
jgi:hypothetical protein